MKNEVISYLPNSRGADKSIFIMESKLSVNEIISILQETAEQIPELLFPVQFVSNNDENNRKPYQIIKDGKKVTQRLSVYDILFGAQDWNGEICFSPYLEVIKEDPDEDEIFILLKNHTKDLFNIAVSMFDKAGFKDLTLTYDESYLTKFFGENW
jgi:hypothetical protein